ncbi:MAG: helix-turn-helix domain-containing protein [Desulfobacterales bacterium]|nr:helix-turn-helix domain-containing protein [Desulfobacterales bacterium]
MDTPKQKLIHIKRAADILGCERKHIYKLINSKKLDAVRIGVRGIRVVAESVDCFIERNRIIKPKKKIERKKYFTKNAGKIKKQH